MTAGHNLSGKKLFAAKALLLDFGGVIVLTSKKPGWQNLLAEHVVGLFRNAGIEGPANDRIVDDIVAGGIADSHWKDAMSRPLAPAELRHEEFWGDFVAADWPAAARNVVMEGASELCRLMGHMKSHRELRNGLLELLDFADANGIPVGIVSNALSGQVHLDFLAENGLIERFAVKVHSDQARVRKPNPEMIWLATRALGVSPSDAWYVGDNFDRDVLCGVRAGIGGNILMEARKTYDMPYDLSVRPDAIVIDPAELHHLLASTLLGAAA